MCVSGLYIIKNKINNNIYVGITNNINTRSGAHKRNLFKGYNNKDLDNFVRNKPRVRHHQLNLQLEFNDFYKTYEDAIWDDVYSFELVLPIAYQFYNKKSLEKIEDAYILKLRESSNGYFQMTNKEHGKKYSYTEKDGKAIFTNVLENNKKDVIDDYTIHKLSYSEIAAKHNSNKSSVMRFLRKYNIEPRGSSSCKIGYDIHNYKDQIIQMYTIENLNATQISKSFNTSCGVINSYLKSWGVELKSMAELISGINLESYKNEVIDMYVNQFMSTGKIANHFNLSSTTIKRYLKKWNIPRRRNSDYYNKNVINS